MQINIIMPYTHLIFIKTKINKYLNNNTIGKTFQNILTGVRINYVLIKLLVQNHMLRFGTHLKLQLTRTQITGLIASGCYVVSSLSKKIKRKETSKSNNGKHH